MTSGVNTLDPVAGLVSYVEANKPYHTKIIEVLVEYIHTDCIDVTITEDFELSLGVPADPSAWGWTEEEANRMFNDNWTNYQISGSGTAWWDIDGDFAADFAAGTEFLVKTDNGFTEYTSLFSFKITNTISILEGSPAVLVPHEVYTTRIIVSSAPVDVTGGAIFHREAYAYDENSATYSLKAGLVYPSTIGVDKNGNCGGYGSVFEHTLTSAALVPNAILGINATLNSFNISNELTSPIPGASTWADVLKYGVKININGTSNNGEHTVFLSVPSGGSPDILQVYVLEDINVSEGAGGTLTAREWGYGEPDVCVNQGQSLEADTHINERLEITVNDVGYNGLEGWDLDHYSINGFDGGPVIHTATLT